jgi:hypothetical protein
MIGSVGATSTYDSTYANGGFGIREAAMAIFYMMFVECADEISSEACRQHFDGLEIELLSGKKTRWSAGNSDFIRPAVEVISFDLNNYGISSLQDSLAATEAGLHLLRRLKSAPEFLFARLGIEVGNIDVNELPDYVNEFASDRTRRTLGLECILHESVYESLGRPENFAPFRPGYVWNKYHGESYRPLYSSDQPELNAKCKEFFPEYFKY